MSLAGQWMSNYTGSNTGTFVLDLDEVGDHYEGTAIAWNDNQDLLNSLVRIRTTSKAHTQQLLQVPIRAIYGNGADVGPQALEELAKSKGLMFPSTVNIDLDLKGDTLEARWHTPVGTSGHGLALVPKSRAGLKSELKARHRKTWSSFKRYVSTLEEGRFIFRGQEDSAWRLRSSFFRAGRADLDRYSRFDVYDLQKQLSGITQHAFDLKDPIHHAAFLNLGQHHGYPTPLLDWTWSPYVAAFFAFRDIPKKDVTSSTKKIRIFRFDRDRWNTLPRANGIFPGQPTVSVIEPLASGNTRAIPQQSIVTFSNVDDIEAHIQRVGEIRSTTYLEALDIPVGERNHAMRELALMGITAGSLFPGLDGACESLKEKNF